MTTLKSVFFVLLSMICLSSCVSYKEPITVPSISVIQDFPIKPSQKEYSRKPIIEKKGNDFLVSDEFVENSVLLKKYADRIDEWKKNNTVQ
jgi:hypothetical protein